MPAWLCALWDCYVLDRSWIRRDIQNVAWETGLRYSFLWTHDSLLLNMTSVFTKSRLGLLDRPQLILGFRKELIRRFFGWPRLSWLVNWRGSFPGAFTLTTESQTQFGLTDCTQEIEAIPGCFIVVWSFMLCTKTGVFLLGWGAHLGKTNKLWDVTAEPEIELWH